MLLFHCCQLHYKLILEIVFTKKKSTKSASLFISTPGTHWYSVWKYHTCLFSQTTLLVKICNGVLESIERMKLQGEGYIERCDNSQCFSFIDLVILVLQLVSGVHNSKM